MAINSSRQDLEENKNTEEAIKSGREAQRDLSKGDLSKNEDKLFAHVHNDHLKGPRYLEGMEFSDTISSLYDFLSQITTNETDKKSIQKKK